MAKERQKSEQGLTVWQPFRDLEEMGRNFEDFFGRPFLPASWRRFSPEEMTWAPAIDVTEQEDKFLIKAELPGVKEEDIGISVSGNSLTIEGEKRTESETKKKGYYYSEATYGNFSRSMTIPSMVDANKIDAKFDNGILEITLPKIAESKPKKISIAAKKKQIATEKPKETVAKKQ
jgi:HSP20 family protein